MWPGDKAFLKLAHNNVMMESQEHGNIRTKHPSVSGEGDRMDGKVAEKLCIKPAVSKAEDGCCGGRVVKGPRAPSRVQMRHFRQPSIEQ